MAALSILLLTCSLLQPIGSQKAPSQVDWRQVGRETFVHFVVSLGCDQCGSLMEEVPLEADPPLQLSSQHFGCADIDVLLPSLHFLYEERKRKLGGKLPGLLVDAGANVGRATARWIAAFGDTFGRRTSKNASQAPCIICAGAQATAGGGASGAAAAPPSVVVVAVEPSPSNFVLLQKHAAEYNWHDEGFLPIHAAMGGEAGEASLAISEEFAVDEVATILPKPGDTRKRTTVKVITLNDAIQRGLDAFPGADSKQGVFMLKLDVEGMEPTVLRSLAKREVPVKFVSFEYAGDVWQESLRGVVKDLYAIGYFCFLVGEEQLYPVSGPFWDVVYEVPVWSNLFCAEEEDPDLEALVQLHTGAVGLWPAIPATYLPGFADGDEAEYELFVAQQRCTDLGSKCGGVTCQCPNGGCAGPGVLPRSVRPPNAPELGLCTLREGFGGSLRPSPENEVTFLRDPAAGDPFLAYRRQLLQEAAAKQRGGRTEL
eukprot:TRINITY_DN52171_c0_g1_i1.p1 TRINITY_DN52171_c0_g1~~TRINITY_DN52171_c0_g1_i1.p1  ORF type:complete len:485 (+),score=91.84 TRINITY_DN52171_c0_g1_i1:114-1568(+)